MQAARGRLGGLREELARLLPPDDPRWYAFGFDRPVDSSGPEVPEHLVLTAGAPGSGMVFADWDDARRADGYRVRAVDGEGKMLAEILAQDSEAMLTGLPSGVAVTVSARNGTGESKMGEGVGIVVP